MKIYTKRIHVLGLTKTELSLMRDMLAEAEKGVTVNYAERQVAPGMYFGISVDKSNEYVPPVIPQDRPQPVNKY